MDLAPCFKSDNVNPKQQGWDKWYHMILGNTYMWLHVNGVDLRMQQQSWSSTWQQVWHDKGPSLLKDRKHWMNAEFSKALKPMGNVSTCVKNHGTGR